MPPLGISAKMMYQTVAGGHAEAGLLFGLKGRAPLAQASGLGTRTEQNLVA